MEQGREVFLGCWSSQKVGERVRCVVCESRVLKREGREGGWCGDVGTIQEVEVGGREGEVWGVCPAVCVAAATCEHVVFRSDFEEEGGSEFEWVLVWDILRDGEGEGRRGRGREGEGMWNKEREGEGGRNTEGGGGG